jgi:hypothetical protein
MLTLAREGLRRLCRLETGEWATRAHLFGERLEEWQQILLQKLQRDGVIEARVHPKRGFPVYMLQREMSQRLKSLSVVSALLSDDGLLASLLDDRPTAPVIELPVTRVVGRLPSPPLSPGGQIIITLPPALYARVREHARELGVSVVEYIRLRLSDDQLPPREPPKRG